MAGANALDHAAVGQERIVGGGLRAPLRLARQIERERENVADDLARHAAPRQADAERGDGGTTTRHLEAWRHSAEPYTAPCVSVAEEAPWLIILAHPTRRIGFHLVLMTASRPRRWFSIAAADALHDRVLSRVDRRVDAAWHDLLPDRVQRLEAGWTSRRPTRTLR